MSQENTEVKYPKYIVKRDQTLAEFDVSKISKAMSKAFAATDTEVGDEELSKIADAVVNDLQGIYELSDSSDVYPTVENCQDSVEDHLMKFGHYSVAKSYILYRSRQSQMRETAIPESFKKMAKEAVSYFPGIFEFVVYLRTYSRWKPEEGRRELWPETCQRYSEYMRSQLGDKLTGEEYDEIHNAILNMEVMPSMRGLQYSSPEAMDPTRGGNNLRMYNCSYLPIESLDNFAYIMYLLMSGVGCGISVEGKYVNKLPIVLKQKEGMDVTKHVVGDTKEGWADALDKAIKTWYIGNDIEFDFSKVRPAGVRLVTSGGRSSGPAPLIDLLKFIKKIILDHQGSRLTPLNVHDIATKIATVVVAGGTRRSAMISLSDLEDEQMRTCKEGQFWVDHGHRSLANNSAVYDKIPEDETLLREWTSLVRGKSGERGIFNRYGLINHLSDYRISVLAEITGHKKELDALYEKLKDEVSGTYEKDNYTTKDLLLWLNDEAKNLLLKIVEDMGGNPCLEILLNKYQLCNLTTCIVRENDTEESLLRKSRIAAILGTYQASLTDFKYVCEDFRINCEKEALLGVSLCGIYDSPLLRNNEELYRKLRDNAISVNKEYAKKFGIRQSTSVTAIKPEGTVSSMVNSASGLHARYAPYYIRRIRISSNDPVAMLLKDSGVPCHPEVNQVMETCNTLVFEFPIKSPENSIYTRDLSAIEQLESWKRVKLNYTSQNPSVTISVRNHEWISVLNWIKENFELIVGVSFLPWDDACYQLAPYERLTKEEYEKKAQEFPEVDFSKMMLYEKSDKTERAKVLACAGGVCEYR
jgi:ribonucleoside-diphosphate reductase alpha chain